MSMFNLLHTRTPRTMPERFAWIMDAMFWAMWEQHARVPDWFIQKAQRRIRRFGNLVSRVLAALEAGTYRARRPRAPRKPPAAQPAAADTRPKPRPPHKPPPPPRPPRPSRKTACRAAAAGWLRPWPAPTAAASSSTC